MNKLIINISFKICLIIPFFLNTSIYAETDKFSKIQFVIPGNLAKSENNLDVLGKANVNNNRRYSFVTSQARSIVYSHELAHNYNEIDYYNITDSENINALDKTNLMHYANSSEGKLRFDQWERLRAQINK